jgi:hypothetical protein
MRTGLAVGASVLLTLAGQPDALHADEAQRARVFVHESYSWDKDGDMPQTAQIIKTLRERCPDVTVTAKKDRADYTLRLDHEGGMGVLNRDNKFVVFDADDDAIGSGSTRSVGSAVKDACVVVRSDWKRRQAAVER